MRSRAPLLLVALAACGRVGFEPAAQSVDAAPALIGAPATMLPFTTVQLTAVGPVTWAVQGGGAVSATGVLTAPAQDGDLVVSATPVADPTRAAQATIHVTRALSPATVVDTGAELVPAGMSHQTHLVRDAGTWWLVYGTSADPTALRARSSSDLVTWTEGPSVTLPVALSGDGRDLAVADAVIAGHHVVHVSVGAAGRARYHVRGEVTAAGLAWGAPRLVNQGGVVDPDGPAVAILASGLVLDGTGWEATPQTPPLSPCGDGDLEVYTSARPDDGATSFDAIAFARSVVWCVPSRSNARLFVPDGEALYLLADDGLSDPDPQNLLMMTRTAAGAWLPDESTFTQPPRVFASDVAFPLGDWSARVLGRQLHAVRRVGESPGVFEHRVLDLDALATSGAPGGWSDGAPLAATPSVAATGLVLVPYGAGLLAVQIAAGGAGLEYAFLGDAGWSPWTALAAPSVARAAIASGGAPGAAPVLLWSEGPSLVAAALP